MFERPHHRRIAQMLEALDAGLLAERHCLFGGGTAISLRFGEYRESVDIDFLVSDVAGYRALRQLMTGAAAMQSIVRPAGQLKAVREVRADQYGIRTMLEVDGTPVKFEIALEARIQLEAPGRTDRICGIAALTPLDMVTSKLLANSDRWADDSACSRDLIDLAMMSPKPRLLRQAIDKAKTAYGNSIETDLAKAIDHLLKREGRLERCMQLMQMTPPKALLWQKIKALRQSS